MNELTKRKTCADCSQVQLNYKGNSNFAFCKLNKKRMQKPTLEFRTCKYVNMRFPRLFRFLWKLHGIWLFLSRVNEKIIVWIAKGRPEKYEWVRYENGKCLDCRFVDFPKDQTQKYYFCWLWRNKRLKIGVYHKGCLYSKVRYPTLFRFFSRSYVFILRIFFSSKREKFCKLSSFLISFCLKLIRSIPGAEAY